MDKVSANHMSPAAREVLGELTNEFRQQISVLAERFAARRAGDVAEVTVGDVLKAYEELRVGPQWRREGTERSPTRLTTETLLAVMGTTAAGALVGITVVTLGSADTLGSRPLTILGIVAGIMLATLSLLLTTLLMQRLRRLRVGTQELTLASSDREGAFLVSWSRLELIARELASDALGQSLANEPLSLVVAALRSTGLLNESDESRFRGLVTLRNRLLHRGDRISHEEFEQAMRDLQLLTTKLDRKQAGT